MTKAAEILTPNWGADSADAGQGRSLPSPAGEPGSAGSGVRLGEGTGVEVVTLHAPGRDWAKLIDLVQGAARHSRELETRSQEQELRVQELLQRVREDIRRAGEQVRVAEMRARDAQTQAEAAVAAAEERVRAAEVRAKTAEDWLMRVHDAIVSGFTEPANRAGIA